MNNATLNNSTLNNRGGSLRTSAYIDSAYCSIVTSDYKYLTKTLKQAQLQYAVQPYYACKIIDDSLITNQMLSAPSQPLQGSVITAPDGNLLAVGLDSSNNVGFWKIPDGSNSALWSAAPTTILENVANNRSATNHYSIKCSEYINGTYAIDVYFFGHFNAGVLKIIHYRSLDGGTTWSSVILVNDTAIPYNTTNNISIAAGKPSQDNAGNIISTVFYITTSVSTGVTHYNICYQQYAGTGTTFGTEVVWSQQNINSQDWVLHSIDASFIKNNWYIVFSGYHTYYDNLNQNTTIKNYNLYITKITVLANDATLDVWSRETEIISALSSSPQNKNSFTLPSLTYNEATGFLYLVFNGAVVTSILDSSNNNNVVTTTNYYLTQSIDLLNFAYPTPIIFSDGTEFTDTYANSFVFQNQYAYLAGNGKLWQFLQNNTVADISNDILSYQIKDSAMNPSSIQLAVGNANNKWYAGTPSTQPGYAAIAKNKKINLFQGYVNASGVSESVPKNIFYIDDIQQHVATSKNDFTLLARDLYKKLKTLTTKFTFDYSGINKYVDIFDGSTMGNYNPILGSWSQVAASNLLQTTSYQGESRIIFSRYAQSKANGIFSIDATVVPAAGIYAANTPTYIYFYYVNDTNYVRLEIDDSGVPGTYSWNVYDASRYSYGGGPLPGYSTINQSTLPLMFVKRNYNTWGIYLGTANAGLDITAFNAPTLLMEVDITQQVVLSPTVSNFAFGTMATTTSFQNFKYLEYDKSENIAELIQGIATKAGIFNYKLPTIFEDRFYTNANYNGSFTLSNRNAIIATSTTIMKTDISFTDIEIQFNAKLTVSNPAVNSSFDFIFRNTGYANQNANYFLRISNEKPSSGVVVARLYQTYGGTQYLLSGTNLISNSAINDLRFDLTKQHNYRVLFTNGYIFLMIDNQVVFGWFDNNNTHVQSAGYIGFRTQANASLTVNNVVGIDLWNQIDSFTLNPGDDLENAIESLLRTIRVYFFSDLMGRLKVSRLQSTDASTYTYQNQITMQGVDNSDKEYINQVTVIGLNNITATAKDGVSISEHGLVRDEVINDNKITTYADALARAQGELIDYNKFNNQFNPKQILNVGSEIFDVVTVVNTGDNTANINQNVRNYSQEIDVGGNSISYWQTIETGKL